MSEDLGRATDRIVSGPARSSAVTIASIMTEAFLGSVLVIPRYAAVQERIGFSDVTVTLVYAAYGIGNLVALLVFGQVSDQIGRKRVAMPALALAAVGARAVRRGRRFPGTGGGALVLRRRTPAQGHG